jgi:hypothetical protein
MSFTSPFQPVAGSGNTLLIPLTTTPFSAINFTGTGGCRINNLSTCVAWFAVAPGTSAGSSNLTATLPTSSAASNTWPMAAGGVESFTFGPNYYLTAITSALRIQPVDATH